MTLADKLVQPPVRKVVAVEVPLLGTVYVRQIMAGEAVALADAPTADTWASITSLLEKALCDEHGMAVLTPEALAALKEWPTEVVTALVTAARTVNQIGTASGN